MEAIENKVTSTIEDRAKALHAPIGGLLAHRFEHGYDTTDCGGVANVTRLDPRRPVREMVREISFVGGDNLDTPLKRIKQPRIEINTRV